MDTWRRRVARIFGNFGVDFLKPLIGLNIGASFFQISTNFQTETWISLVAAMVGTFLALSRELADYGSAKRKQS
jgi:ABC-type phosphate/phosphonate transport system permease subunit